jgi:rubrerythrin
MINPDDIKALLDLNEKPRKVGECRAKVSVKDLGEIGILVLTDSRRLVFIVNRGSLFRKAYEKDHYYGIRHVKNIRIESGAFGIGKRLVIEWDGKIYRYEGLRRVEDWVNELLKEQKLAVGKAKAEEEVVRLLNYQESTTFNEIEETMVESYPEMKGELSDKLITEMLADMIAEQRIEGFIDKKGRRFTHKVAYERKKEVVEYKIATSFDFRKDGAIVIRCPHCNRPYPKNEKKSKVRCPGCGNTYSIPEKILSLM